jgi:hypothetical protein
MTRRSASSNFRCMYIPWLYMGLFGSYLGSTLIIMVLEDTKMSKQCIADKKKHDT